MFLQVLTLVGLIHAQTPAPSFSETVLHDFEIWDTDHNGALTEAEVDQAVLSPRFHGNDAAALAALHGWLAATKDPVPPLTKSWFQTYKPVRIHIEKGTPADEAKKARKAYATSPDSLQSSFVSGIRRLGKIKNSTELFADSGPELTDIRQGALGDCYMLAPLGAMVNRDPQAVHSMIRPDGDGYAIHFADGKEIKVGPLTDAELAMGGSGVAEGLWIRVIEKAYGSRKFGDGEVGIARDGMNGGNPGKAGIAFTGHTFTSYGLVGNFKKEVTADDLNTRLTRLRQDLPKALADKRLVLASTPSRDMPTSINGNHAYAIFAFDAATDRVTLWNPHGNDFKPKGPEGTEFGYERKNGVFSMPLPDFVHTFGRVYFESSDVPKLASGRLHIERFVIAQVIDRTLHEVCLR